MTHRPMLPTWRVTGGVFALTALMLAAAWGSVQAARQASTQAPAQPTAFDLIILGGRVVDGSGSPWFRADVGVSGGRITRIGDLSGATAARRIDATGLIVAPGFRR